MCILAEDERGNGRPVRIWVESRAPLVLMGSLVTNQDGLAFKEHVFDALGFVRIAALFEDVDDVQKTRRGSSRYTNALHAGEDAFDDALK